MGHARNKTWKKVHYRNGVKQTLSYQAHEDKLYIDTSHEDSGVKEATKRLQIEQPIDKHALSRLSGQNLGKLRWMFNWPNSLIQAEAHARFPGIKSKNIEERLKAYYDMAQYYKPMGYIVEIK